MSFPLVLASKSDVRRHMLQQCGFDVTVHPADIDERALENDLGSRDPEAVAEALAAAKARAVSQQVVGMMVVGADQVLHLGDTLLHKAADLGEAKAKLLLLQGKTHTLTSSAALAHNGRILWSGTAHASLHMRSLSDKDIDAYLSHAGDAPLASVGAYRIEERGAALFERIEGDSFTIMGLPLLALLAALRDQGIDPLKAEEAVGA